MVTNFFATHYFKAHFLFHLREVSKFAIKVNMELLTLPCIPPHAEIRLQCNAQKNYMTLCNIYILSIFLKKNLDVIHMTQLKI